MKWVIIKGVRYPSSVISAFAAYNMDNPFLKVRIRNKYHIVPFDDVNKMANQMVYLMDNYPDFVQIGRWWISKKAVMSWVPKGQAVDGSGWVISFTLSFGLEGGTQIRFDKEDEYLSEIDRLNELFNVILYMKVTNIFCKKHIKMENKEQDFINRYKNVQESIVKAMDKALERAIGNKVIDFEKCEGNYLDVYPLIGAVLQKELRSVLGENVNKSISRNMKIKATKYRNDYRVWLDYAGDYRNENIE